VRYRKLFRDHHNPPTAQTLQDDRKNLEGLLGRTRARNARLLRYRYKEGFDRLGIVLFALFALVFLLMAAFVHEPFALPAAGTPEAATIDAEIAAACADDIEEALQLLCRERILGAYRWAYYSDRLGLGENGWLFGALVAALGAAAAWPAGRWVAQGFRRPAADDAGTAG